MIPLFQSRTESTELQALLMPEEGLEPPTRGIMIPWRFGSTAPFAGAGGHKRGQIRTRPGADIANTGGARVTADGAQAVCVT